MRYQHCTLYEPRLLCEVVLEPTGSRAELEGISLALLPRCFPVPRTVRILGVTLFPALRRKRSRATHSPRVTCLPVSAAANRSRFAGEPPDGEITVDALVTTRRRSAVPGALRRLQRHARLRLRTEISSSQRSTPTSSDRRLTTPNVETVPGTDPRRSNRCSDDSELEKSHKNLWRPSA